MLKKIDKVPFFNYPKLFLHQEEKFIEIIRDVLSRGAFIMQRDLEEFEAKLAKFTGAKHALGVSDGTNAITLGLRACGVGPGDEVIFSSHTMVATPGAIVMAGAIPVPCDVDEDGLMDAAMAEKLITSRTRMLMPTDLNGRVADMRPINELAAKAGLIIAEDAAQALGATYHGISAGLFGKFGTFSFYPAKSLGCFGDGGGFITNDDDVAAHVRAQRDHGRGGLGSAEVTVWGTNSRLDNVQAAILSYLMDSFDQNIARRRQIAARYDEAFSEIEELILPPKPDDDIERFDTFQNYEIRISRRDELREFLAGQNIGTIVQWGGKAVHQFESLGFTIDLPETERFFNECLLLPMNHLLTDDEVSYVIAAVRKFHNLS